METLTVVKPDNLQRTIVRTKEYVDAKCASVGCGECADIQSIVDNAISVIKQYFIDNGCGSGGGVCDHRPMTDEEVRELIRKEFNQIDHVCGCGRVCDHHPMTDEEVKELIRKEFNQ